MRMRYHESMKLCRDFRHTERKDNSWALHTSGWVGFQVQTIKITKKRSQYFMKKLEEKCSGAATSSAIALACHKSTSVLGLCHPGLILQ